jgi:hypothetical protein
MPAAAAVSAAACRNRLRETSTVALLLFVLYERFEVIQERRGGRSADPLH